MNETTNEPLTTEQFEALSSEEKSKISGFKHYSEEEILEKTKKSDEIVAVLFRKFFEDLLANEAIVIGHLKTDEEKESTLTAPLNNLYQNAIDMEATMEDVEAVQRAMFSLAKYIDRVKTTYSHDLSKLMFAMVGENYPDAVPLKTLINLTKAFKDTKSNPQA